MCVTRYAEEIACGHPSPQALEWLADGFRRYLADPCITLPSALGLDAFPRGLRDAVKTRRAHRHIAAAARLLDVGQSSRSLAIAIRSELLRLARRPARTATTGVEFRLLAAMRDGCPLSLTQLRDVIAAARSDGSVPLQTVDAAGDDTYNSHSSDRP